jgi:hypothetical protein
METLDYFFELKSPQRLNRAGNGTVALPKLGEVNVFSGIRCPHCGWQPDASSRWCCHAGDSPEPFFHGCGTIWNTFATRGCCPGCSHQWQWTSCLRCDGWSPHEDWYEQDSHDS